VTTSARYAGAARRGEGSGSRLEKFLVSKSRTMNLLLGNGALVGLASSSWAAAGGVVLFHAGFVSGDSSELKFQLDWR
jgi:hypothetical protein